MKMLERIWNKGNLFFIFVVEQSNQTLLLNPDDRIDRHSWLRLPTANDRKQVQTILQTTFFNKHKYNDDTQKNLIFVFDTFSGFHHEHGEEGGG
ncbi:MAG: hypothetical protein ACOYJK_07955 [Prevotella sp.]|jgi:hypothetical protein